MYTTPSTQQSWEDGEEEIKGCQGEVGVGGEWPQVGGRGAMEQS